LQAQLADVEKRRLATTKRRSQEGARVVCVVGYTNAGKSSLLNRVCDAGLWEMDQVFATLDPAARRLRLPNGGELVLIDTVGFIRRLPTALVEAFKSTLEVVLSADLLLHVSDAADPAAREKENVVLKILDELGAAEIPALHLLNKIDLLPDSGLPAEWLNGREAAKYRKVLPLSLKTTQGLDTVVEALQDWYESLDTVYEQFFPHREGKLVAQIYREGRILEKEQTDEGVRLKFTLPAEKSAGLQEFLKKTKK
jgi:GTP-binding protein HflX